MTTTDPHFLTQYLLLKYIYYIYSYINYNILKKIINYDIYYILC